MAGTVSLRLAIPLTHIRGAYAQFKQEPITDKALLDRAGDLLTRIRKQEKSSERKGLTRMLEDGRKTGNTQMFGDVMDIIEKYMDTPIEERKGTLKRAKEVAAAMAKNWKN